MELGPDRVSIMCGFVLLVVTAIFAAKLEFADVLLVAALRCLAQLALLGLVLEEVFALDEPTLVFGYIVCMILLASREGFARTKVYYRGMLLNMLLAFLVSIASVGLLGGFVLVLRPDPFIQARYLIPICGMMLGNGLTGLTLATDLFTAHLTEKTDHVEALLAYGAGPWLAMRPGIRSVLKRSMLPTINQMSVAGLVSIPGMMTGQVLGGSPPLQAALYQVFIFYLITTGTFASSSLMLFLSARALTDRRGRLVVAKLRTEQRIKIAEAVLVPFIKLKNYVSWRCCGGKAGTPDKKLKHDPAVKADTDVAGAEAARPPPSPQCLVQLQREQAPDSPGTLRFRTAALREGGRERGPVLLRDVDFSVCNGCVATLLGPSGCGKSTLLRALADLLPNASPEELSLEGKPASGMRGRSWRQKVRYVAVPKAPMEGSARDLAAQAARLAGVPNLQRTAEGLMLDWGMDPQLFTKPWNQLSTGQTQRLFLCIALASNPSVLLLDEPTSALDDTATAHVEASLRSFLQRGGTAVVVTHSRAQADRLGRFGGVWEVKPAEDAGEAEPFEPVVPQRWWEGQLQNSLKPPPACIPRCSAQQL